MNDDRYCCNHCPWTCELLGTDARTRRTALRAITEHRLKHMETRVFTQGMERLADAIWETEPTRYVDQEQAPTIGAGMEVHEGIHALLSADRERAERCARVWRVLDERMIQRRGW